MTPATDALPRWVGIGLRGPHLRALLAAAPPLAFVEVHSENVMAPGGTSRDGLRRAAQHWPVSLHGVGLGLGSAVGIDEQHLDQLAALVAEFQPRWVSDHACFARAPRRTGAAAVHAADLLPLAFTPASLDILVANVDRVQQRLGRPLGVENLSAVLRWADDVIPEPEFLSTLVARTGCSLLVDVNNLVVNALNAQTAAGRARDADAAMRSACAWVDAVDGASVGELHVAGHDDGGAVVIDDHGSRVREPVWAVLRHAVRRWGPRPTLVEWDTALPPLPVLLEEAARAEAEIARAAQAAPSLQSVPTV